MPSNATCMGSGPDLTLFSPCSPINPDAEKIFHLCFLPLLDAVSRCRFWLPFLVAVLQKRIVPHIIFAAHREFLESMAEGHLYRPKVNRKASSWKVALIASCFSLPASKEFIRCL